MRKAKKSKKAKWLAEQFKDRVDDMVAELCSDFIVDFEEASTGIRLRLEHEKECQGIRQTGNTARFCSCITGEMRLSIISMFKNWHSDIARRISSIKDVDGMIEKRDALYLISENGKWE